MIFIKSKKIWRWLKSFWTPKHKHVWVDKDSTYNSKGEYLGTLFICYCGKMEIDSTITNRVLRSLVLTTLKDLPPLSDIEYAQFSKFVNMPMRELGVKDNKIVWKLFRREQEETQ